MSNAVGFNAPTAPFLWRDLYLQALFETDRGKICARISAAERALFRRERELFTDRTAKSERDAVINALNALHALRNCLGVVITTNAA